MSVTSAINVSNLQALTGPFSTGDVAVLDGYYEAGDGGGGNLYFEDSIPDAAKVNAVDVTSGQVRVTTIAAHGLSNGTIVMIAGVEDNDDGSLAAVTNTGSGPVITVSTTNDPKTFMLNGITATGLKPGIKL